MKSITVREYLRRHVLGLLAIFIALSGTAIAAGGGPTASTSAVTTAKFKKLKQRVGALESTLNSPAKGDLTGTYPNLQIAANAVTTGKIADNAVSTGKIANNAVSTTKIADNAVGTTKIADNAVNAAKIVAGAVGSSELAAVTVRSGSQVTGITDASAASGSVACLSGEQPLSALGSWDAFNAGSDGQEFSFASGVGSEGTGFTVGVGNQSGATRAFTPQAECLAP